MMNTDLPQNALQDRKYLGWEIPDYHDMAMALGNNCFRNKEGQHCSIAKAKLKKLRDLKWVISKNPKLANSLIFKEQLRLIEFELQKRKHMTGADRRRPLL